MFHVEIKPSMTDRTIRVDKLKIHPSYIIISALWPIIFLYLVLFMTTTKVHKTSTICQTVVTDR